MTTTSTGATITVTDINGTATVTIKNGIDGANGRTPVKGTDYWTAADQQQIVNDVLAALPIAEAGLIKAG